MRAIVEVSVTVTEGELEDVKGRVQAFVNDLYQDFNSEDTVATIEPLETDIIEIEPE